MEIDLDKLVKEGQEYIRLRKDFKLSNNPHEGSAGYLISKNWMTIYKDYIQYEALKKSKTLQ